MKKELDIAKDNGFKQTDIDDLFAVNSVKSGKVSDFDKIMNKYYNVVLRKMMQYHSGNATKAEDDTSKVMVVVYENLSKWKVKDGKFRNWVYRIAYNTFIDGYRKSKKNQTVSVDALFNTNDSQANNSFQIEDKSLTVEEKQEKKDNINKMLKAVESLSETDKKIIKLRYISGMSFDDIAEELNLNKSTCRVTSRRALEKLKKKLS